MTRDLRQVVLKRSKESYSSMAAAFKEFCSQKQVGQHLTPSNNTVNP